LQSEQQGEVARTTEASLRAELELLREGRERTRKRMLEERGRLRKAAFPPGRPLGGLCRRFRRWGEGEGRRGMCSWGVGRGRASASEGEGKKSFSGSGSGSGSVGGVGVEWGVRGEGALVRDSAHMEIFRALAGLLDADPGAGGKG